VHQIDYLPELYEDARSEKYIKFWNIQSFKFNNTLYSMQYRYKTRPSVTKNKMSQEFSRPDEINAKV